MKIVEHNDEVIPDMVDDSTTVSYTQFALYSKCPKSWELAYARRLRKNQPSIHSLFGTAMHNTIQEWIVGAFSGNNQVDPYRRLRDHMIAEFEVLIDKWGEVFSTPEELTQFHDEGIVILRELCNAVLRYFNPKKFDFVGTEVPINCIPVPERPKVKLVAYLDLVLKAKNINTHHIRDIKTSTKGWNRFKLKDIYTISQLVLYKHYYAKMNGLSHDDVEVNYLIVKRGLDAGTPWVTSLIQEFRPIQSTPIVNGVVEQFEQFILRCFNEDGTRRLDIEYPAISGVDNKNCKFCEFADQKELCPKSNRIKL